MEGRERRTPKIIKPVKPVSMARKLMKGITMIILLALVIPIMLYEYLPDEFFLLIPGVRMWIAADMIHDDYGDTERFMNTLESVEKQYDLTAELYDADGSLVYTTNYRTEMLQDFRFPLREMPKADKKYTTVYTKVNTADISLGNRGYDIGVYTTQSGVEVDFLILHATNEDGEKLILIQQTSALSSTTKIALIAMTVATIILLTISIALIGLFLVRISKPMKTMVRITDKMTGLDFSEKCPPTKVKEFSELAEKINLMSDSLDTALTQLKEKNEKLQKDIEDERTLDQLRSVFISGVSHELKTPIAIIQGYAEGALTFLDSSPEAAKEYCTVIMDESVRMNRMVMKLLEITKYDSGAYEPSSDVFSIRSMFETWFEKESVVFAEQGITAVNDIPEDCYGRGDSIILASVANNYLSNAVSHVDGEKIIRVYAEKMQDCTRVNVFNTGKQIADKDIDKIWNSFYRADKSMSRSQGRFGLGLAIVASIQRLHHRDYGVENQTDGVRFWFDIETADMPENK